jgi:hypothetical protein
MEIIFEIVWIIIFMVVRWCYLLKSNMIYLNNKIKQKVIEVGVEPSPSWFRIYWPNTETTGPIVGLCYNYSAHMYLTIFNLMDPKKYFEAPKMWRPCSMGLPAHPLGRPCIYDKWDAFFFCYHCILSFVVYLRDLFFWYIAIVSYLLLSNYISTSHKNL